MSARREWVRRGPYTFSEAELLHLEDDFDETTYREEVSARRLAKREQHPCIDDEPHPSEAERDQSPESAI